jgi:hypothetical protein
MSKPIPQLSEIREYAAAGAPIDCVADAPNSANKASYVRVVAVPGNSLELTYSNGTTRALTVVARAQFYADIVAVTANSTCGPVQIGWE